MKKYICIVGSTILSILSVSVIILIGFGLMYLVDIYIIARIISCVIIGLGLCIIGVTCWNLFYEHCREYWGKKENNKLL